MTITFTAMNLIMKWLRCEGWATAYGPASQSTGCRCQAQTIYLLDCYYIICC